ncbi:MAG: phytanoyl-CoA dioxygenase family protein [Herpetosiphonaceae bacterium]|nr:phytanoyl-CoA dioxygenase family protein [Herpetosiphonaceae bacterium]
MQLMPEERTVGKLSDVSLKKALRTLRDAGLVVIEDVFDRSWVTEFRAAYDEQLERYLESKGGIDAFTGKTFGQNHIGMHLPMVVPFSDPQVIANPIAVQVMAAALGDDLRCSFYHSNTAYPGSKYQHVHRDTGPVFRTEFQVPTPVTHVVLNIPLCDFTLENGSTEVWPGSHLIVDTDPTDGSADELEARVEHLASTRTNIPAGSIVVRDLRMWHRGMPNNSQEVRTMLAIVYQRGWAAPPKPLEIPRATWKAWPEEAREIFRGNTIVESLATENAAVPA